MISPSRVPGAAVAVLAVALAACGPSREELAARYPLVPAPARLEPADGAFTLGARTRIVLSDPTDAALRHMAEAFAAPIRSVAGVPLPVEDGAGDAGGAGSSATDVIFFEVSGQRSAGSPPPAFDPASEAYTLTVGPGRIHVSSSTRPGLFRGFMALRQLLPPEVERGVRSSAPWGQVGGPAPAPDVAWSVPAVEIVDRPRFAWRGMHLDVGRHFFPVEFVKKYIDLLALHRMNVFHWHLTEDQGWRIQIDAYPRLTEVGSCRDETMVAKNFDPYVGDGERYCGFYTKDEVREVVAYAAERHVTVVPEIEMPGHSLAALAAYPELACTEGPFEVGTSWGVFEDIYCPSEETFTFLETVLGEVMELFPSPWIHIGGDEAPKARWEQSDRAQEVIRREGLADEEELQSWFVRRIERFLSAHGRRLIGWDEILEGGLPPEATVMSWRGMEGGVEAARQGHDVVMTPTSHVYFDYYQADPPDGEPLAIGGFTPLEEVYAFEPVPSELSPEEARRVLGAQGNVWTEYIESPGGVEYMALPRMAALAEVVWSPSDARDPEGFFLRLERHLERLRELGVRYRGLDPELRTDGGG
ncbi:MAG: beta-N-acetylhexosaminidase [Gemmatimonadota bacterium]|jgi:hexosaminidase